MKKFIKALAALVCCLTFVLSSYLTGQVLLSEEFFVVQKVVACISMLFLNVSVIYLMVSSIKHI